MAINSGVGPHAAWLNVNGQWPVEHGSVSQSARRKTSSFACAIPMEYPGAAEAFANLGDNTATITVLARGATATLFTGEVDEVDFDFIHRTIHVIGRDKSKELHNNKSSEKWQNKKPSDIVEELVGRIGLSGNIAASAVMAGKQLQQDYIKLTANLSFAQIINKLAHIDGARWWVDAHGIFNYQPFGSPIGIYSITIDQDQEPISADCLSLRIKRNVEAGKSIQVTVKSWHPKKKQIFQYQSNVEGNGGPIKFNYHIPTLTQPDVERRAKSRAMGKAIHELVVAATVVGDPTVMAGMGLSINGTDWFDQTYDIDTVNHDFGMPGYRTHITARSPKNGRSAS